MPTFISSTGCDYMADSRGGSKSEAAGAASWRGPFRHPTFRGFWTATLISYFGDWMYVAGLGWLIVNLDANPLIVSLIGTVQVLPMFLLAIPAGTLADIIDRRVFLIMIEGATTIVALGLAVFVSLHLITPVLLLTFAFLIATCGALSASAQDAIIPTLVQGDELGPAINADITAGNLSRVVGPPIAGLLIGLRGIALPFWLNALSNLGFIIALVRWKPPTRERGLPPERLMSGLRIGFRHARENPQLRATLARTGIFFFFPSAYWALLPLVARRQLDASATGYGILFGAIGVGGICSTFLLPLALRRLTPDRILTIASAASIVALVLYGVAHHVLVAFFASMIAGAAWMAGVSLLTFATQIAVPDWVRARGLAMHISAFSGALAIGSVTWGKVASGVGLPTTFFAAAVGLLICIPLSSGLRLPPSEGLDLRPSGHWPPPITVGPVVEPERGPVLVMLEYFIDPKERLAFVRALRETRHERGRDGAHGWALYEDPGDSGRFIEMFLVESWLEHLRQHDRVTVADQVQQDALRKYYIREPRVSHFVAAAAPPRDA